MKVFPFTCRLLLIEMSSDYEKRLRERGNSVRKIIAVVFNVTYYRPYIEEMKPVNAILSFSSNISIKSTTLNSECAHSQYLCISIFMAIL